MCLLCKDVKIYTTIISKQTNHFASKQIDYFSDANTQGHRIWGFMEYMKTDYYTYGPFYRKIYLIYLHVVDI